jgi:hypothetical protein
VHGLAPGLGIGLHELSTLHISSLRSALYTLSMLDFLTPGHHATTPIDVLIEVATLAAGLAIAAGLKIAVDTYLRRRRRRKATADRAIP